MKVVAQSIAAILSVLALITGLLFATDSYFKKRLGPSGESDDSEVEVHSCISDSETDCQ